MFIVINCLGMPFNGDTIKTESLGGSESAAYYVAKGLAKEGHKVTVFTASSKEGEFDGVRYLFAGVVTQNTPMGDRFHFYAQNTPSDVLIIQRHPLAFRFNWASKVNLWWLHDLALIRSRDEATAHIFNVDGVLCVSEFHKEQVCETYGLNKSNVFVLRNGVDLDLFALDRVKKAEYQLRPGKDQVSILYSSRPERGLENLVKEDGIMERLKDQGSKAHLYVCAYDNTTDQMKGYYDHLEARCKALDNVTLLGNLTKQQLADVMFSCDALVYPTPGPQQLNFEEVSCITAMEAAAAGLPFISSNVGALKETTSGGGVRLHNLKDGECDIGLFVSSIKRLPLLNNKKRWQLDKSKEYDWSLSVERLLLTIEGIFNKSSSRESKMLGLLRDSDIYTLKKLGLGTEQGAHSPIADTVKEEVKECYDFAFSNKFKEHYKNYYEYEARRGVVYGPESLEGNTRFEHVSGIVSRLPNGSSVLDYGCAHGHYAVNLAKRFPKLNFVGVDIAKSNIEKAHEWKEDEGLTNLKFVHSDIDGLETGIVSGYDLTIAGVALSYDLIIAAEVLEHVASPGEYVDKLLPMLESENGLVVLTTPYGPWEGQGYKEHYPWRAHLHHLEREDLNDMWGHFPEFNVVVATGGETSRREAVGSYITTFKRGNDLVTSSISYKRKLSLLKPQQTISVCMIVKDAESTLRRCLDSIAGIATEIIIAVDIETTDRTVEVIGDFMDDMGAINEKGYKWPIIRTFSIESPLKSGFDAARNKSILKAQGDWILWIDSDEVLIHPDNIYKYLRNNQFSGYAIRQQHFAAEPVGVLKTDKPCRVFRNRIGIKFFGLVHEHPEKGINEGLGQVLLIPDMEIIHQGYTTEAIRRKRFDRNIGLLARDREAYPDRVLGKFLWLRDLAQMSRYEYDMNGGVVTSDMQHRARVGMEIWEELLEDKHLRMIVDGLEYYDTLTMILGNAFKFGFKFSVSKLGEINVDGDQLVQSHFHKKEHAIDLFNAVFKERTTDYESKYF